MSHKLFQKRKYQKGWFVNSISEYSLNTKKSKSYNSSNREEIIVFKELSLDDSISEPKSSNKKYLVDKMTLDLGRDIKVETQKSELNQHSIPPLINFTNQDKNTPKTTRFLALDPQLLPVTEKRETRYFNQKTDDDLRLVLALLGLLFLFFTSISPIAIWIALGSSQAVRVNARFYLSAVFLVVLGLVLFVVTGYFGIAVGIILLAALLLWLISVVHAVISIIRGY